MKVTHLITALHTGGAEMMLYRLLQHSDQAEFEHQVISMTDIGAGTKNGSGRAQPAGRATSRPLAQAGPS
jgi:hypothetical protein